MATVFVLLSQMFSGGLFCLVTKLVTKLQAKWKSLSNDNLIAPNTTLLVLVAVILSEMHIISFCQSDHSEMIEQTFGGWLS